jgi:hypothetical protein
MNSWYPKSPTIANGLLSFVPFHRILSSSSSDPLKHGDNTFLGFELDSTL